MSCRENIGRSAGIFLAVLLLTAALVFAAELGTCSTCSAKSISAEPAQPPAPISSSSVGISAAPRQGNGQPAKPSGTGQAPAGGSGSLTAKALTPVQKEEFYRRELEISQSIAIKPSSMDRLVERSEEDEQGFQRVVLVAKRLVQEKRREALANEIMVMRNSFVRKLSERVQAGGETEALKSQTARYLNELEDRSLVRVSITPQGIKDLFQKKLDTKAFISRIWG